VQDFVFVHVANNLPIKLVFRTIIEVLITMCVYVSPPSGCWVHCNDARIKYCSSDEVAQSQAYILFYIRRHGITSDASAHVIPTTPVTPFISNITVPSSKRRKLE